jgi:hypothetical protein
MAVTSEALRNQLIGSLSAPAADVALSMPTQLYSRNLLNTGS